MRWYYSQLCKQCVVDHYVEVGNHCNCYQFLRSVYLDPTKIPSSISKRRNEAFFLHTFTDSWPFIRMFSKLNSIATALLLSSSLHQLTLWNHGDGLVHDVVCLLASPAYAGTHCANLQRDGQAELTWVVGYVQRCFTHPKMQTYPASNRSQRSTTTLIKLTNTLPLSQIADQNGLTSFYWTFYTQKIWSNLKKLHLVDYQLHTYCLHFIIWQVYVISTCALISALNISNNHRTYYVIRCSVFLEMHFPCLHAELHSHVLTPVAHLQKQKNL